MPTAAKLSAAVAFALAAFFVAEVYKTTIPERTVWGAFSLILAGLGLLCGWLVMGSLAGRGYRASVGYGLRTIITVVFWALLGFAIYQMILRSMAMRYRGPMDALLGAVDLALEYGQTLLTTPTLSVMFAGGVLGGMVTEWASRRWP